MKATLLKTIEEIYIYADLDRKTQIGIPFTHDINCKSGIFPVDSLNPAMFNVVMNELINCTKAFK